MEGIFMSSDQSFSDVFKSLKNILKPYAEKMDVKADNDESFYLETGKIHPINNKPAFFGSAIVKKNYVSFYLMPVYEHPDLLDTISPELKKRMQGKSCFNFKKYDTKLFSELAELTRKSYERYVKQGLAE